MIKIRKHTKAKTESNRTTQARRQMRTVALPPTNEPRPGKKAFTLIEISIYFTIVGILMLGIISFSTLIFQLSNKSLSMQELNTNLDFISYKISTSIKYATSVNTALSLFNRENGKLSLHMPTAINSPTTFQLIDGAIYLTEGSSVSTKISSDNIVCSKMQFEQYSAPKTPDLISYEITCKLNYEDPQNKLPELTIQGNISLIKR